MRSEITKATHRHSPRAVLIGLALVVFGLNTAVAQVIRGRADWIPPHPIPMSRFDFPPGSFPPQTPTAWQFELGAGPMIVEQGGPGEGVVIRELIEGLGPGMIPHGVDVGQPELGMRLVDVLLPYDADLSTVQIDIGNVQHIPLGQFDVEPGKQPASYDMETDEWEFPLPEGVVLDQEGRDIGIYGEDRFWPAEPVRIVSTGQIGKYRYVRFLFSPFQWNPAGRHLRSNGQVQLSLSWERQVRPLQQVQLELSAMQVLPAEIGWINIWMLIDWYTLQNELQRNVEYDYIIITTLDVKYNSTMIDAFENHKESLGYRVITVSVESIEHWYPADETATSIREFLQEAYWIWGLTYCLLIGDPDPDDKSDSGDYAGAVPMKMTWLNGSWDTDGDYPTDFYYAELTGDWDDDGDGWAAEVDDDGVVEYGAELLVGRIPYEDIASIDPILERTIAYEEQAWSPPSERNMALLGLSFNDSQTDAGYLGEQLIRDSFNAEGLYTETYYQAASSLPWDGTLIDGRIPSVWGSDPPGLVLWWGHGSSSGTTIGYSGNWDGELMYDTSVGSLDESAPSFVVQISCTNAKPEVDDNITHELIKGQAVSAIAASRTSIYYVGETSYGHDIDNGSIGYHIATNHAEQDPAGVSMSTYRWSLFDGDPGGGNWKSKNLMVYNLYGDPSLEFRY